MVEFQFTLSFPPPAHRPISMSTSERVIEMYSKPYGFLLHTLTPNNRHEHGWPISTSSTLRYQPPPCHLPTDRHRPPPPPLQLCSATSLPNPDLKYRRTQITLSPPLIEGCGRWGRHVTTNQPTPTQTTTTRGHHQQWASPATTSRRRGSG